MLVLNPAAEPTEPSKPRVLLNILISLFLGTLLGVGAAMILELGNRRVRSAADLAEANGLPVLASIASTLPKLSFRQVLYSFFMRRRASKPALVTAS